MKLQQKEIYGAVPGKTPKSQLRRQPLLERIGLGTMLVVAGAAVVGLTLIATPQMVSGQFIPADTEFVNPALRGQVNVNSKNSGLTALIWAATYRDVAAIKLLLKKGANVNARANDGSTALMAAAQYGYTETVDLLLDNGANVHAKDNRGKTALDYAEEDHPDITALLRAKMASSASNAQTTRLQRQTNTNSTWTVMVAGSVVAGSVQVEPGISSRNAATNQKGVTTTAPSINAKNAGPDVAVNDHEHQKDAGNYYSGLALDCAAREDLQGALDYLNMAIKSDQSDAEAYENRGVVYNFLGLKYQVADYFPKAIDDFSKAIKLNPRYAKAYDDRGTVYRFLWREKEAEADMLKAKHLSSLKKQ